MLDFSHNHLSGNIDVLSSLQSLVNLNISYNNLSGQVPNTTFFRHLTPEDIVGNEDLHFSNDTSNTAHHHHDIPHIMNLITLILICIAVVLILFLVKLSLNM
ncbi:LRR receptor-like serine/threonine-protein kinase [Bienertia sinuspersici]